MKHIAARIRAGANPQLLYETHMSDPTQPDGIKPEAAPDDQAAARNEAAPADVSEAEGAAPQAQAYVDPSIAAEAQVLALEAEIAGLKDKFIRAHAEMDNLRKRTEREKADTSKYAISKFAGDMLAVADNLQRAIEAFAQAGGEPDPQTKALIEGVELTDSELSKALDRHGVRKIEALGEIFDPNFHQAVMEEENKDVAAGTVLRVFQEGYKIGDRVLRPTMVVVSRGGFKPTKTPQAAPAQAANDDAPPVPNGDGASNDTPESDQSA